ncbi:MAG: tetratricopeptide repeat protein, partial [Chitinophagia bacterium]|nr:tetratricopeptide repeat protein [Chitinophagia bacterium]
MNSNFKDLVEQASTQQDVFLNLVSPCLIILSHAQEPIPAQLLEKLTESKYQNIVTHLIKVLRDHLQVDDTGIAIKNNDFKQWIQSADLLAKKYFSNPSVLQKYSDVLWIEYANFYQSGIQKNILADLPRLLPYSTVWKASDQHIPQLEKFAKFLNENGMGHYCKNIYLRCEEIAINQDPNNHLLIFEYKQLQAKQSKENGERAIALAQYINCLDYIESHLDPLDEYRSTVLNSLGQIYRDSGEYSKAQSCLEDALSIQTRKFGTQNLATA